jgi:hypothetical protein
MAFSAFYCLLDSSGKSAAPSHFILPQLVFIPLTRELKETPEIVLRSESNGIVFRDKVSLISIKSEKMLFGSCLQNTYVEIKPHKVWGCGLTRRVCDLC